MTDSTLVEVGKGLLGTDDLLAKGIGATLILLAAGAWFWHRIKKGAQ